ncbi:MAG: hypothetical protein KatS3mg105_3203 [Gemmatales bacterium]|nr:MAG: hypothetical protein KatS3mg105_3203 [Gemmatales bacterium]
MALETITPPNQHVAPASRSTFDPLFVGSLVLIGGSYVLLIVAMLVADAVYTTPDHFLHALSSREIRFAVYLTMISCSITAILSVWVAVPLGYLLSRYRFFGKTLVDAIVDIPVVLPPLVIGLSLLILFQTQPGRWLEKITDEHMGLAMTYYVLPGLVLVLLAGWLAPRLGERYGLWGGLGLSSGIALVPVMLALATFRFTSLGPFLESYFQEKLSTKITYAVPAVVLAQFSVACAFAVRTMRVTFDQLTSRQEQVALALGCSRSQAFWLVVIPEARRGIITAATLAWARALGEFGPILVFAGATRMKTEVLSTTVFLELSVGSLEAAVAVSLIMVATAALVLVIVRVFGIEEKP